MLLRHRSRERDRCSKVPACIGIGELVKGGFIYGSKSRIVWTFHWISLDKLHQLGYPASPIISMGLNWILEKWIHSKPRVSNVPSIHRVFRFLKIALPGGQTWPWFSFIFSSARSVHRCTVPYKTLPLPPPPLKEYLVDVLTQAKLGSIRCKQTIREHYLSRMKNVSFW